MQPSYDDVVGEELFPDLHLVLHCWENDYSVPEITGETFVGVEYIYMFLRRCEKLRITNRKLQRVKHYA